jgi:hypothetical protein
MSKIHKVRQQEHISGIARENGFLNFNTILDHPKNAALKARRDPHVLFPGDEVFIPDKTQKKESGATTQVHVFAIDEPPLFLHFRLRDLSDNPIKNAPYDLQVDSKDQPESKNTDGDGLGFPHEVDKENDKNGEVKVTHKLSKPAEKQERVETLKLDLKIGGLNPETTLSGQQARLNNLGYFAGFALDDFEQLRWAVEEFQCDHMGQKPVKKIPEFKPESEDPKENTGVQDAATQAALLKEHGV